MKISHVVAMGLNNEIGMNNTLLWHLPNDMRFFKNITWGMPVVMGRKTYTSLAGKPLPGRFNIVLTNNLTFNPQDTKVKIASTLHQAIEMAKETDCKEVFIIGGGEIYKQSLELTDRIYLTRVLNEFPNAEVFYPSIDLLQWKKVQSLEFPVSEKHVYPYNFEIWERIK
ncbi:MAG: dihydrofolate reductase [Chitinophagaceae bacterium]|nr:dihydrofolate reductase [Chitinophagaceae bacterium]